MCECCKEKLATEVHHVIPIAYITDPAEQEALAFNVNNLQSLCRECHYEIHRKLNMERHNKRTKQDNDKDRINDFITNYLTKEK